MVYLEEKPIIPDLTRLAFNPINKKIRCPDCNKPANISADEWALILSHRTRKGAAPKATAAKKSVAKKATAKKAVAKKPVAKKAAAKAKVEDSAVVKPSAGRPARRARKARKAPEAAK